MSGSVALRDGHDIAINPRIEISRADMPKIKSKIALSSKFIRILPRSAKTKVRDF